MGQNEILNEETPPRFFWTQKHIIRQIWVSIVSNFLQIIQGFVVAMSSIMIPQLLHPADKNEFVLTLDQSSWFATTLSIGYLLGSFVGAFNGTLFGQRISLMIDCAICTTGLFIIRFSYSYPVLLIGAVLCGVSSGSGSVTIPIYSSEICQPEVRGLTGSFLMSFYIFGYCFTTLIGSLIHWRHVLSCLVFFPILTGIILFTCPNSPIWLIKKSRECEALKSFQYFSGNEKLAYQEFQRVYAHLKPKMDSNKNGKPYKKFLSALNKVRCPSFRKPFMIIFFLTAMFFQWNGLGVISFYMVTFVNKVGIPIEPYAAATVNCLVRAIFSAISFFWIAKYPRRKVYLLSITFMGIGTLMTSIYHVLLNNQYFSHWGLDEYEYLTKWIPALSYFTYASAASSGYLQITYMLQGELFPSDLRSIGCGIIGICDGISMIVATKFGLYALKNYGVAIYFGYSTLVVLLCWIFVFLFLPETHRKHLVDIESSFKSKSK